MMKKLEYMFSIIPVVITRNRWWVIAFYIIISTTCFFGVERIIEDDSLKSWFGKDSKIFKDRKKFEKNFGTNEDVYIVYEAKDGDIFSERSLEGLKRLHNSLADFGEDIQRDPESPMAHTKEVVSLMNIQVTRVEGDSLITREFIGKKDISSAAEREDIKEGAFNNEDLIRAFLSEDGRFGAISIKTDFGDLASSGNNSSASFRDESGFEIVWSVDENIDEDVDNSVFADEEPTDYDEYFEYMQAIRTEVKKSDIGDVLEVYYAGLPEIIYFQYDVIDPEMPIIFAGLFLLMVILLFAVFKSFIGIICPSIIAIISVLITLGAIGWIGVPTSSLSEPMVLFVILISVADSVHLISTFNFHRQKGDVTKQALKCAFRKAGLSCFFTTFTTVVGFGSLWIAKPSVPIENFGLFCAIGILTAFLVTMTLLPVMLHMKSSYSKVNRDNVGRLTRKASQYTFGLVTRGPLLIVVIFACIITFFGYGFRYIKIDTNIVEGYKPDSYIRQAFDIADKYMGGTQNIDFMVDLNSSDALYDPEVLRNVDKFQQKMSTAFPELIVKSISIANVMKRVNQQLHSDNPNFYRMPETDGEITQLLFLFNNISPDERRRLVSDEFDATRINFTVKNKGSTAYVDLVEKGNLWFKESFKSAKSTYPDMELVNAGGIVTFMHLFERITYSQIQSFLITLVIISVMLIFVFGSIGLSLLSVISSLVPIIITFGTIGWLGLEVNQLIMIVAPIILGIAVDDSIHLINKLRGYLSETNDVSSAVRNTLHEVFSPLAFTTIVLAGGLLMMLYSSDMSFKAFGYLSALAISSAFLTDILLIPSICLVYSRRLRISVGGETKSVEAIHL